MIKKKSHKIAWLISIFFFSIATPSFALDKIYSPNIVKGEIELEYSLSNTISDDATKNNEAEHEFELEYAPSDHFKLELEGVFAKEPQSNLEFEAREFGGIYAPFSQGQYWADIAIKVMYVNAAQKSGNDAIEAKLLLEKQTGHFINTINFGLEREIGSNVSGNIETSLLWNIRYTLNPHFNPGIELQSELGAREDHLSFNEQSHYLGATAYGKIVKGFKYELGYFWGLSDAAAQNGFRLLIEYETHF